MWKSRKKKDEILTGMDQTEGFRGKKLLLVEDNELNREIAVEILTEYGFVMDIDYISVDEFSLFF